MDSLPAANGGAIPPTEDLMREHGVLMRLLLIYRHVMRCLIENPFLDFISIGSVLYEAATITERFIEDYHQRLEEQYVFPRFLCAEVDVDLVNVLLEQHAAARSLTTLILGIAPRLNPQNRAQLVDALWLYIQMYEPHSAREDTVLFPAFRQLVSSKELEDLGDLFEDIEERQFGKNGFQRVVSQVERLEQILGIYDLASFTPPGVK